VFDALTDYVSGSPWTYVYLVLVSALDAVIPIVPSETSVITAGVLSADGDLFFFGVVLAAWAGAVLGDNASYWIGRTAGHRVAERLFRGSKEQRLESWEERLSRRGGYFIIIGRFIPGGRTAVTLAAGTLEYPWRKFFFFDVIAGGIWATYAAALGFFGGKTFEDHPLFAFLLAFGIALAITGLVEAGRWYLERRGAKR
jgi:membrane-associated protein